ncbi:MAG: site-2 protease family protein [Chloroflexota bacterium]|nr:site-2 protease family protein [Chloroflexota bacterium]
MRGSWRIGRIMGIDVAIDASWFVIVFLLVYSLGFAEFPRELHPLAFFPRPDLTSVTLGVVASLLLFASVLAHELSHSWMAIHRGIPVSRITLFIFGGVAQITREPDRAASELLIAIMGPLMSVALTALFGAAWLWLRIVDSTHALGISLLPLILLTSILAQVNGSLALFNLAPGFPLDGGRVFRAILWGVWRDFRRATRWATRAGQLIALILIAAGAWLIFAQSNLGGIWYGFIGLFLWNAASEGYRQTLLAETLRGVRVDQLMTRSIETVSLDLSLTEFIDQHLLPKREQTFGVMNDSTFAGTVSIEHVKRVPRAQWSMRRVRDVMTPSRALAILSPDQTAADALARLSNTDAEELPVIEMGQLVGFLGRRELSRYLRLKSELERG